LRRRVPPGDNVGGHDLGMTDLPVLEKTLGMPATVRGAPSVRQIAARLA
jgi:hypothetical protein